MFEYLQGEIRELQKNAVEKQFASDVVSWVGTARTVIERQGDELATLKNTLRTTSICSGISRQLQTSQTITTFKIVVKLLHTVLHYLLEGPLSAGWTGGGEEPPPNACIGLPPCLTGPLSTVVVVAVADVEEAVGGGSWCARVGACAGGVKK